MIDSKIMANKNMPPLDDDIIYTSFGRRDILIVRSGAELTTALEKLIPGEETEKSDILFMSSGSFGGIDLKRKRLGHWTWGKEIKNWKFFYLIFSQEKKAEY